MPQYQTWEEFSRAAEKLYLADPMKARVVLKYRHSDGSLCIKVTDDLVPFLSQDDLSDKLLMWKPLSQALLSGELRRKDQNRALGNEDQRDS
ncbi:signal recognition particle 9 kDa protein isoform X1 [Pteropus medius]|uniref:Signal recognition particle 9 kDa protein isoform X1 n=1 Tax=Pteropus vampyrus TaxID=132908 RepID=A0A6P6CIF2_PTEVA|nr:signal recognition particle 9 kDa protein isoform X1 [Pteropus vampyrus]XP_039739234.1 signal recognition particle 9 kDa protein isoform X1 [Pteropus giganteus]